ncbi:MAG: Eco57I restriction-modification methylase domain-containing protein [Planctomycetota bacterium]|jgi:hypothetical protein
MVNSFLKIGTTLQPLLEQQISPPYGLVARHLDYLQKWRKYLLWAWYDDSNKEVNTTHVQEAVDDLILTILLIDFVRQSEIAAIPSLGEILRTIDKPTAHNICEAVRNQIPCRLLKHIFCFGRFSNSDIAPDKNINWSSLTYISEATDAFYASQMPTTVFGDFHQLCIDRPVADRKTRRKGAQRRTKGIHYTPAPLVDYLVLQTLKRAFHKLEPVQVQQLRILDPSCGCGAFLIAALRYTLMWFKCQCSSKRQSLRLNPQETIELLRSMIFGKDIDNRATQWTRKLLLLTAWGYCINSAVSKSDIHNLNVPDLKENVACKDFLETHSDNCEKSLLMDKPFDIIIGGPPFVRVQELYKSNPELVNDYKRRFITARTGQFDLYMLFIEKSIGLLADEGCLGMSVSGSSLRSQSGRNLRKLVADTCNVREIIEFEDSSLYPNAKIPITLFLLRKTSDKSITRHIYVKGKGGLRRKLSNVDRHNNPYIEACKLPTTACSSTNWMLESESKISLLSKIESDGIRLGKLPIRIRLGIATGADDVFLLRNVEDLNSQLVLAESRFLDDIFVFESSVLRPILRGRHIRGYSAALPQTLCIFPYDNTRKVIAEDIFSTNFPRVYRYLVEISQVMQSPKLVASVVNSGGGFALDKHGHILCNNSVVILCPNRSTIDTYFLRGVLNSSVFKVWSQNRMPNLGSGWHSYRVNIMRNFPVPTWQAGKNRDLCSKIAGLTRQLLSEGSDKDDRPNIMSSIDNKVIELYDVSGVLPS